MCVFVYVGFGRFHLYLLISLGNYFFEVGLFLTCAYMPIHIN